MTLTGTRAATGIAGLDDILQGGFVPNRLYLVEGMPGSGKTTLAFQFMLEGVQAGESVLYLTLSETAEELRSVADGHGWSLEGIHIRELVPLNGTISAEQYTMFHPAEIELDETTQRILADVEQIRPSRVVFDSLSELRLIAGNPLRYRRQILALKQFFVGRRCTVLLLDDLTAVEHDLQVQSLAHGALLLEHSIPHFGIPRRRLSVTKYRGSDFRGGYHDYVIRRGGLDVFPRLVAAEHRQRPNREQVPSGIQALDLLLGGGIERGTSTLLTGAAGTGKSSLAALFAVAAAERGQNAAMFIFDESANTLFSRMAGLHVDLGKHAASGRLHVNQVDPAELCPGEFAHSVRDAVLRHKASVVVIDSLNGYLNSMPDERFLIIQLHELLTFLGHHGVASILVSAQHGLISSYMTAPVDASYLADAVVLMRYFEAEGEVRQAISVVKKRGGDHERTIREFKMHQGRIAVGEPLRDYRGVLTGDAHEGTDLVKAIALEQQEQRLLVLAPTGRDSELVSAQLGREGIQCAICPDLATLVREADLGAGALFVAEEAVAEEPGPLAAYIARQPPWSDLPILVATQPGADSPTIERLVRALGNITLLERPIRVAALSTAVNSALRARERQYQTRSHLHEREEADRRKDEFLATLAHELRNPLAPLRNSLQVLRLSGATDTASVRLCDIMERQVAHMVRLVDDLLEISRITRGKIELRKERVELAAVIHAAVETSRPGIEAARHELCVRLPDDPLLFDADPIRMAQVFSNLLNNAAKYTEEGGRITLTAERQEESLVVAIRDSGMGIPEAMLPRIFDMFVQVAEVRGRPQGGLGIGLTLVRSLVELHGGSVLALSAGPGQGSEFVVRLPLAPAGATRVPERTAPAASALDAPLRLLVVDDNRDAADSLGLLLQMLGASVEIVYDGSAALDLLPHHQPDAVFLDLGMPGLDGYEVARRIRRQEKGAAMILVALTGWGQERDRRNTESAGFDHHLIKPADMATLRALLASFSTPVK